MSIEDANKNFERFKIYDSLKNEYCKKNNIHLLRIYYRDRKKIPEILEKVILKQETIPLCA
jgi:uncharacterized membrane protein